MNVSENLCAFLNFSSLPDSPTILTNPNLFKIEKYLIGWVFVGVERDTPRLEKIVGSTK